MTIQTWNDYTDTYDYTDIKWLYMYLNTIQTWNDYTDMEWLYRHGMTIQTLNDYTDIKYYTFNSILYI